jgi:hypothetical protein
MRMTESYQIFSKQINITLHASNIWDTNDIINIKDLTCDDILNTWWVVLFIHAHYYDTQIIPKISTKTTNTTATTIPTLSTFTSTTISSSFNTVDHIDRVKALKSVDWLNSSVIGGAFIHPCNLLNNNTINDFNSDSEKIDLDSSIDLVEVFTLPKSQIPFQLNNSIHFHNESDGINSVSLNNNSSTIISQNILTNIFPLTNSYSLASSVNSAESHIQSVSLDTSEKFRGIDNDNFGIENIDKVKNEVLSLKFFTRTNKVTSSDIKQEIDCNTDNNTVSAYSLDIKNSNNHAGVNSMMENGIKTESNGQPIKRVKHGSIKLSLQTSEMMCKTATLTMTTKYDSPNHFNSDMDGIVGDNNANENNVQSNSTNFVGSSSRYSTRGNRISAEFLRNALDVEIYDNTILTGQDSTNKFHSFKSDGDESYVSEKEFLEIDKIPIHPEYSKNHKTKRENVDIVQSSRTKATKSELMKKVIKKTTVRQNLLKILKKR